jgi:hypothetical protein
MAEKKPLSIGSTGLPTEFDSADTLPVSNVPTITSAKVSDFTEAAQDAVGAMADTNTLNYSDATPSLAVRTQMSITSDASGLKLSGDESSPGNSEYYGTNGAGAKGFHPLPAASAAESATMTAGENLAAGDLVYVAAAGTVFKADANTAGKEAVGFVTSAISSAASGTVYFGTGIVSGLTSLTPGSKYFLSASVTGGITTTPPSGASDLVQLVGWAKSATELFFQPQAPLVRAAS